MTAHPWFRQTVASVRTANPYVVDTALAALVLFAATLHWTFHDEGDDPLSGVGLLLAAGTAIPLIWRRRAPFACAWVVTAATPAMAVYHAPPPDVMYGGLVVLYTVALLCRPWQRRLMLVGWLVGTVVTMAHVEHPEPFEYAFHTLSLVCAYGLGVLSRVQRAYLTAVEDRARRLVREREADTARAIAQERALIARDMHDILAHAVSLMVVQAEAGPVALRGDPARAQAAFDAIAANGREAMGQLRRILGVLKDGTRDPGSPNSPGAAGAAGAAKAPQPGIAALPALVRQVGESARLHTELGTSGEPRPLPPDTEVAAYRIAQEALTNTVKHAYASSVTVELDWGEKELTLTVTDDGRGPANSPAGQGGRDPQDGDRTGRSDRFDGADGADGADGHGLLGIGERAAACGGSARTGAGPHGGFRVVAHLPTTEPGADGEEAALG